MEGSPARGTHIPLRLFLSPYPLTPTFKSVNNRFSVRYFINLVLVDDEDRRYFKQQEITLYRSRQSDRPVGVTGVPRPAYLPFPAVPGVGGEGTGVPLEYLKKRPLARPSTYVRCCCFCWGGGEL